MTFETESEVADDVSRELRELQTEHAALVMELDKVNMLLDIQYKLKQDYQDEVGTMCWTLVQCVGTMCWYNV